MPPVPSHELARLSGPAAGLFLLIALAFVALGGSAQALDLPFGLWFTQLAVFLLPAVLFVRAFNLEPRSSLGLVPRPSPAVLLLTFFAAAANYLFAAGLMGLLDAALPESWHVVDAERVLAAEHGGRLLVVLAGVFVAAPLCEEAAFRGALQAPFVARLGPRGGILLTALLFSALHLDPVGFLPRVELGLFFGWLAWRSGSLWPAMLAHAVNNGLATLLYFLTRESGGEAPETSAPLPVLLWALGLGALLLLPLLRAIAQRCRTPAPGALPLDEGRPVALRVDSFEAALLFLLGFLSLGGILVALGGAASSAQPLR